MQRSDMLRVGCRTVAHCAVAVLACVGLSGLVAAQTVTRVGIYTAVNVMPQQGVVLSNYEGLPDPLQECTTQQTIQMEWDTLLIRTGTEAAYAVSLRSVRCRSSQCGMLSVDGWSVTISNGAGFVNLVAPDGQFARYSSSNSDPLRLLLVVGAGGKARLCVGAVCPTPTKSQGVDLTPDGWVSVAGTAVQPTPTLQLGYRGNTAPDTLVMSLWVLSPPSTGADSTALNPIAVWSVLASSTGIQQAVTPPVLDAIAQQPGSVVVGQPVTFSTSATVAVGTAACQVRITVYGVPPSNCKVAGCGNLAAQTVAYASTCSVSVQAVYPRAGRYLVRAEASDVSGGWSSKDLEVIVRKVGDNQAAAPCCRQTALIITSQLGRPIHTSQFRPNSLSTFASSAGWASDYMQGPEDMEAERLFDYGMMTPSQSRPASNLSCADYFLAGLGSPAVFGVTAANLGSGSNQGHNKRVVVVPQGFNWTANPPKGTSLPGCAVHWTDWPARSPYQSQIISSTNKQAACSYTCTPDGVQQMVEVTGAYDRWREAVIENTYGQLSLAPEPVVVPTLYMPPTTDGRTAFAYSEYPVSGYLQSLGYNMTRDFHTVLVLSPQPRFVNPGYTAWANGYGSPLLFVMRCNPQHYYLLHEIGHRLGMPHATVYKLSQDNSSTSSATLPVQVPSNPMASGVMEDTYSDRLDIMACCKGDYSLYNRILSGWVPATERAVVPLQEVATPPLGGREFTFMLWPYDRPESVGQLKGVTVRVEDGKVLSLGFRSLAFWQDLRVGRSSANYDARPLQPQHSRTSLAGLSVEYSKRFFDAVGNGQWSRRGVLDFNRIFARYPEGLPGNQWGYPQDPPGAAFTVLREGDAWLDVEHNLLLAVDKVVECSTPAKVPVWRYGVYNFYGFRGENPGEESPKQADYTGYKGPLQCLQLRIRTGVAQAPGALDVRVRLDGLDPTLRLVTGGARCGFQLQPRLTLVAPEGANLTSIVWRDNTNTTFATGKLSAQLPPLSTLSERSATGSEKCNQNCDWSYHIKAMAADGGQTLIDVTVASVLVDKVMLRVRYTYYLRDRLLQALETHTVPVVQSGDRLVGSALLSQPVALSSPVQLINPNQLPDTSCSKQWTLTTLLQLPAGAWDPSKALDIPVLAMQPAGSEPSAAAGVTAGQPGLLLRIMPPGSGSQRATLLLVVTVGGRERWMDVTAGVPDGAGSKSSAGLHVALVRDNNRLGVWGNSVGGWVLQDFWCIPASPAVTYCNSQPSGSGFAVGAVQLGQAGASSQGIKASYLRVYNYALPTPEFVDEARCASAPNNCGRYLLQGWPRPPEPASSGSIQREGVSIAAWTASTPIDLPSTGYYLLVGPWSACSARCGGGWSSRTVRCMQMPKAGAGGAAVEVDMDGCPLVGDDENSPASSRRCNTVACPQYELQLTAPPDGMCSSGGSCLQSQQRPSLVCASSYGYVQPLQACLAPGSNTSSSPSWSNLRWPTTPAASPSSPAAELSNKWRSSPLCLSLPSAAATLADAVNLGYLNSSCGSAAGCTSSVRWKLGPWGACSKPCGGGTCTRTAQCLEVASGAVVSNDQCSKVLGGINQLTIRSCNPSPCDLGFWKVTSWSTCAGDAAFGQSSRTVTCVTPSGATAAAALCTASQPNSTTACVRTGQAAVCRPAFVPQSNYGGADCYGHGTCSMLGCSCDPGWSGQFCEVPSSCRGVMTKSGQCCNSGKVDTAGSCCAEGAVLDAQGACCNKGWVDVCGTCGGKAWLTDALGTCCETRLDAAGLCCASGYVDECGVCDGDSSSCALDVYLSASPVPSASSAGSNSTAQVQQVANNVVASLSAAGAGLWRVMLAAAVVPAVTNSTSSTSSNSSRALPADAVVIASNPATRRLQHQGLEDSSKDNLEQENGQCTAEGVCSNEAVAAGATTNGSDQQACPMQEAAESGSAAGNGQCSVESAPPAEQAEGPTSGARQLQQLPTTPQNATTILVRVAPSTPTSPDAAAGVPLALTALSGAVTTAVQQLSSKQVAAGGLQQQPYGVLSVQLIQRIGVCSNGVCEVGEQGWQDSQGNSVQDAAAPCPQDCPLPLVVCSAPVALGNSSKECGGNGRCLRTLGICDCFFGYTGDSCGMCAAGYYAFNGSCQAQYIDGLNIFNDPNLAGPLSGWQLGVVITTCVVMFLVLVMLVVLWVRARRRGMLPRWLGGRRLAGRKRKYDMQFDAGAKVVGGSGASPTSDRIGTVPSPRGAMLQRLRWATDSPMSSMGEDGSTRQHGGLSPLDTTSEEAYPVDDEVLLGVGRPPSSPSVRALQRVATNAGSQLNRAASGAGQQLSRAATAAQQGLARVLSGVPGVGPQLSAAISRGGSYQYTPVGSLEGEFEDRNPRYGVSSSAEQDFVVYQGVNWGQEMVPLSPRTGAQLGVGRDSTDSVGATIAPARSMEEVYTQVMRNKEAEAAAEAVGRGGCGAGASSSAGWQQGTGARGVAAPGAAGSRQEAAAAGAAAASAASAAAAAASGPDSKRARRVPAAAAGPAGSGRTPAPSRFAPSPAPAAGPGNSLDPLQQQQQAEVVVGAGGVPMPRLRVRTAAEKPPEIVGMAPFQLPQAGNNTNNQQQAATQQLLEPWAVEAARAARASESGAKGWSVRPRQRAVSQQGGPGTFVSTPDYGDRDGIVAFGRRMEQWFSPERSSSGGGGSSSSGGGFDPSRGDNSGGNLPVLPVSRPGRMTGDRSEGGAAADGQGQQQQGSRGPPARAISKGKHQD